MRLLRRTLVARRNRIAVASRQAQQPVPDPLSIEIAVYFSDTKVNLYQMRQWYAPLAELSKSRPVAVIARSPSAALKLWDECPVPVLYLRRVADLEEFVHSQQLKIVFYVNQNARNFQMFRYGRLWHVFINHGESDKMYMTTNQFKAYDYSLVAGEAALERLRQKLWDFDLGRKAITIGRPQADHFTGEVPYPLDERTVVLYAPTWEGDRAAAAYGSIATHGVALATALLASGKHRLVYRPHPRSGVADPDYAAANQTIIAAIARANEADPAAQHVYDTSSRLGWQLAAPDVAITDISAMVYDRLATGKPVIVTRPKSPDAEVNEAGYLAHCEWLHASASGDILAAVDRVLVDREAQERLGFWAERHFGDTTPGAATRRFHAAVEQLISEWHRHHALHEGDLWGSESDPLDDDELSEGSSAD